MPFWSLFVPDLGGSLFCKCLKEMAGTTRLELATSAVTETTQNSYKTSQFVGWVVGWKTSTNSERTAHSFPRTCFSIVSELPTIRPEHPLGSHNSAFRIGSGGPTMRQNLLVENGACMPGFVSRG